MADETIEIRYIGKKKLKPDNVNNTDVIWIGHGDIQDYPKKLAGRLLLHPDVWDRPDGGAVPVPQKVGVQKHDEGEEDTAKTPADGNQPPASVPAPPPQTEVNSAINNPVPDSDRVAAIKETLGMLDPESDFNGQGYPKIDVVREASGLEDLKPREVNAIWQELNPS